MKYVTGIKRFTATAVELKYTYRSQEGKHEVMKAKV